METRSPVSRALSCAELLSRFKGDAGGGRSPLTTEACENSSTLGGRGTERQGEAGTAPWPRGSRASTRSSQASKR